MHVARATGPTKRPTLRTTITSAETPEFMKLLSCECVLVGLRVESPDGAALGASPFPPRQTRLLTSNEPALYDLADRIRYRATITLLTPLKQALSDHLFDRVVEELSSVGQRCVGYFAASLVTVKPSTKPKAYLSLYYRGLNDPAVST
jgi:hypothetical protein